MCSVAGFLIFKKLSRNELEKVIEKFISILIKCEERGKDSFGVVFLDNEGNFHTFKVIDKVSNHINKVRSIVPRNVVAAIANCRAEPTTEYVKVKTLNDVQPMLGNYVAVTHNGIIVNDLELERKYSLTRISRIDTAILPPLLEKIWDGTLENLQKILRDEIEGSFALAILDRRKIGKLWLANNFKPLYMMWHRELSTFYFASLDTYLKEGEDRPIWDEDNITKLEPYAVLEVGIDKTWRKLSLWRVDVIKRKPKVLVIASGGLDSTVVATYLLRRGYDVTLLHFNYRHKAEAKEKEAIHNIAKFLNVPIIEIETDIFKIIGRSPLLGEGEVNKVDMGREGAEFAHEWVPARNLIFYSIAMALAEAWGYDYVASGVNLEESITGDTEILIQDSKGRTYKVSIKEFVESEKYVSDEFYVLSLNKYTGRVEKKKVVKKLRHVNKWKKIVVIRDEYGNEIKVTPDHSIITLNAYGRFVEKRGIDVKPGDYLIISLRDFPYKNSKYVINLFDYIDKLPDYLVIIDLKEKHEYTIGELKRNKGLLRGLNEKVEYLVMKLPSTSQYVPVKLVIDEKLSEFLGYYVGNGLYYENYIVLLLDDFDELYRELITPLIEKFNIPNSYIVRKENMILMNFTVLLHILKALDFSGKLDEMKVPEIVYSFPTRLKKAFLRGYFTAKANVNEVKGVIELTLRNRQLVQDLSSLLKLCGIMNRVIEELISKEKHYKLIIDDTTYLDKFAKEISFLTKRKRNLLYRSLTKLIRKSSTKTIQIPKTIRSEGMLCLEQIFNLNDKDHELMSEDIVLSKVTSVQVLSYEEPVYDISVEDNENFILVNGVVVHNSGSYPDNEMEFIRLLNNIAPYATGPQRKVKMLMPVGHLVKHEIVKLGLEVGAPLHLTWSCYEGGNKHCGRCGPCYMRRWAFKMNGIIDPVEYDLPEDFEKEFWKDCKPYRIPITLPTK